MSPRTASGNPRGDPGGGRQKQKPVRDSREPEPDAPEVPGTPSHSSLRKFRSRVLGYYRRHGRTLAWRQTSDPYCILVSEIMLQQTQVSRVTVEYPAFLAAFPDFPSLAAAPLPDLLAAWQGMGYNRRVLALQKCARRVMEEFGGSLPDNPEILATFPGIGKATAASICAFAYKKPVVFIETNIRRVFIHCFFPEGRPVRDAEIIPLVEKALYRKDPRVWYWALMDLGSALKDRVPNPNRRSAGYVRQPAFRGSDREIRGRILRILLASQSMDRTEILRESGCGEDRLNRILPDLEKEGFLFRDGNRVALRNDTDTLPGR